MKSYELCFCGSGEKYQSCCMKKVVPLLPSCAATARKALLYTLTDEPLMPIRLYYSAPRLGNFIKWLQTLSCVKFVNDLNNCVIYYCQETKSIGIGIPAAEVPEEFNPALLAYCSFNYQAETIIIDLLAFESAYWVVKFISHNIPLSTIFCDFAATYNRFIYTANPESILRFTSLSNYDAIFADPVMTPELNNNEKDLLIDWPLIEKFPVCFANYGLNDGLKDFKTKLKLRYTVAAAISEGDNRSMKDFFATQLEHVNN